MIRLITATVFSALSLIGFECKAGNELAEGSPLPDIEVLDQDGQKINLANFKEQPYVLVYFYPKADTPGCTAQACSLRDAYEQLSDEKVTVFGVSTDSPESQKAFKTKYGLPFTLIADKKGQLTEAFGVPLRGHFASRQAYLFADGILVWRDTSASTQKQADDVMSILASRSGQ